MNNSESTHTECAAAATQECTESLSRDDVAWLLLWFFIGFLVTQALQGRK